MLSFELIRLTRTLKEPQRGVLMKDGEPFLSTLELPWVDNTPNKSCIPLGRYSCKKVIDRTTSGGMQIPVTFEVTDVKGRSGILFHVGNFARDTHGCILLGLGFDASGPHFPMITRSEDAFKRFLNATAQSKTFAIRIRRFYGAPD